MFDVVGASARPTEFSRQPRRSAYLGARAIREGSKMTVRALEFPERVCCDAWSAMTARRSAQHCSASPYVFSSNRPPSRNSLPSARTPTGFGKRPRNATARSGVSVAFTSERGRSIGEAQSAARRPGDGFHNQRSIMSVLWAAAVASRDRKRSRPDVRCGVDASRSGHAARWRGLLSVGLRGAV